MSCTFIFDFPFTNDEILVQNMNILLYIHIIFMHVHRNIYRLYIHIAALGIKESSLFRPLLPNS